MTGRGMDTDHFSKRTVSKRTASVLLNLAKLCPLQPKVRAVRNARDFLLAFHDPSA